jgi:hypothetical protein
MRMPKMVSFPALSCFPLATKGKDTARQLLLRYLGLRPASLSPSASHGRQTRSIWAGLTLSQRTGLWTQGQHWNPLQDFQA